MSLRSKMITAKVIDNIRQVASFVRVFMCTLLLTPICVLSLVSNAQVSYGDITFGSYNMKINLTTDNDSIFLNVIYSDESRKLSDKPKLLLRLTDDSIIALDGIKLDSHNKSDGGVLLYGVYIESSHFVSEAKFPISKEQIRQFVHGIKKLRLNTSPKYHEKTWRRDKIGKKLYERYLKSSPNSFEDGF